MTIPAFFRDRREPAAALAVGLAIIALNLYMIHADGIAAFWLFLFGGALTFAAGFAVIVGKPRNAYQQRPDWYYLAIVACGALGALATFLFMYSLTEATP